MDTQTRRLGCHVFHGVYRRAESEEVHVESVDGRQGPQW